jgi:pimeloyl-ACP methyl ester carboxylesterase
MTTTVEVQDKTVSLRGLQFHYRDWPNAGARPLVLLHGFSSHARSWDRLARAMQPDFRVLALDQRGHGESAWTDDYGPERMVEDVDEFLKTLGLDRIVLLGLSMGGRNAYSFTAQHPEKVERLAIIDIGPEITTTGMERIMTGVQQRDVFDDPEEAVRQARAANPRPPDAELRHRTLNNLKKTDDGRWTWRYDKALRSSDRPRPRPDAAEGWKELGRITCPTLLVRGAESDILSVETAERMVRTIPNCRLVTVPDAGHSIPLDNPEGFISAVRPFLLE